MAATRKPLLIASLLAGICVQAILALMQELHVLPSMAQNQALLSAQFSPEMQSDLAERLRNGGSYGTFALANNLGIMLVIGCIVSSALCLRTLRRKQALGIAGSLLCCVLTLAALATTGSKGAVLGLLLAGFGALCWIAKPRLRYALIGLAGGASCALVILGPVADIPSVSVRLELLAERTKPLARCALAGHWLGTV